MVFQDSGSYFLKVDIVVRDEHQKEVKSIDQQPTR